MKDNGTPYTKEQWKKWYQNHKSSDELRQEAEESINVEDELKGGLREPSY